MPDGAGHADGDLDVGQVARMIGEAGYAERAYTAPPGGEQAGPVFGTADTMGELHAHLHCWVKHPSFDPGSPFFNPIADGAYALLLELTSNLHATSETQWRLRPPVRANPYGGGQRIGLQ